MSGRWTWTIMLLGLGCSLDASGLGSAGGTADGSGGSSSSNGATTNAMTSEGSTSTDSGMSTTDTTTGTGTTQGGGETEDPTNTTDPTGNSTDPTGGTSGAQGGPLLQISDAPTYDFQIVEVSTTASHTFTVTNVGDDPATSIMVPALSSPYTVSGSCPDPLDPGENCTLAVDLAPTEFGAVTDTLTVQYEPSSASAEVELEGAGGGTTGNLIVNPGGENNTSPPAGWTEVVGTNWYTPFFGSQLPAHSGNRIIYPGEVQPLDEVELRQDVSLADYATAISQGALRVDFSGWGISGFPDQDNWRYVLEFHDGNGIVGAPVLDTDWELIDTWTERTASELAPAGATFFRVRLRCRLLSGMICDGGFDDIVVRASYAP